MKKNLLKEGTLAGNFAGIGTVTRKLVREHTVELAVINGRSAQEVSKSELDQAKRELTGEPGNRFQRSDSGADSSTAVFGSAAGSPVNSRRA